MLIKRASIGFALAAATLTLLGGGPPERRFGDPLPGLSKAELARFNVGKEAFEEEEFAEDGLGPVFTESSCVKCHGVPASGGGSSIVETRIGRYVNGVFDSMLAFGGPVIQNQGIGKGVGVNGPFDFSGEVVPPEATVRAGRRSTATFGLGLVEGVPDKTLVALAEWQRLATPATAGRPHFVKNLVTGRTAVGRFGWKAQLATLFDFAGDAYTNEVGITTPLVPDENCPQGDCDALAANPLPNGVPNDDNGDLFQFADFMRFLAPPPPGPRTAATRLGEAIFLAIGCANCHVPTLQTGRSPVRALNRVTFSPYSDFLLHNMGSLGDSIVQGDAKGREMRTAPLWGVAQQETLLHDGRATSIADAIRAHDGQGRASRNRFVSLADRQQRALIAFVRSL